MKLKAFTLAEVLIVLTVIGIVAVLTIPTLMSDWQQRRFETALKKAINTLENNNKMLLSEKNSTDLSNICGENYVSECMTQVTALVYNEDSGMYVTKDGISFKQTGTGTDSNTSDLLTGKYYEVLIDVNGAKSPNNLCQDQYKVWVDYNGLVTDVSGCDSEYTEYTTSSEDTEQGTTTEEESNEAEETTKLVGISCNSTLDRGYGTCANVSDFESEDTDIVAKDYESNPKYNASSDGTKMTCELAEKICNEKGLRLPGYLELNSMYNASKEGKLPAFNSGNYWGSCTDGKYRNCYMGAGNCGTTSSSTLNYARCVK